MLAGKLRSNQTPTTKLKRFKKFDKMASDWACSEFFKGGSQEWIDISHTRNIIKILLTSLISITFEYWIYVPDFDGQTSKRYRKMFIGWLKSISLSSGWLLIIKRGAKIIDKFWGDILLFMTWETTNDRWSITKINVACRRKNRFFSK